MARTLEPNSIVTLDTYSNLSQLTFKKALKYYHKEQYIHSNRIDRISFFKDPLTDTRHVI